MLAMTLTDLSGRILSGHTVEAFWYAVRHARPVTVGLNCSFGAQQLRPHVQTLSHLADTLIMVYPNAGLPNELGQYDEMPEQTRSEEHTSELQSLMRNSYAVFCLKKKKELK